MTSLLKYFFDVPVYRLPEIRYYEEREPHIDQVMYPKDDHWTLVTRELHKRDRHRYIAWRDHLERRYGGCWRYNEIIAYIRLYFFGSEIRGEYYSVVKQRLVRSRTKVFEYRTRKLAPEIGVPCEATNAEIFDLIRHYLQECQNELPRRHIDTTMLDALGPYLDWRRLFTDRLRRDAGSLRSKPERNSIFGPTNTCPQRS